MNLLWLADQINPPMHRLLSQKTPQAKADFWAKVHNLRQEIGDAIEPLSQIQLSQWLELFVWPVREGHWVQRGRKE